MGLSDFLLEKIIFNNLQVVAADNLHELGLGYRQELLLVDDSLEMLQHVRLGLVPEVRAGVGLGEAVDAQAVGLVHVLVQELTARVAHRQNLEGK